MFHAKSTVGVARGPSETDPQNRVSVAFEKREKVGGKFWCKQRRLFWNNFEHAMFTLCLIKRSCLNHDSLFFPFWN